MPEKQTHAEGEEGALKQINMAALWTPPALISTQTAISTIPLVPIFSSRVSLSLSSKTEPLNHQQPEEPLLHYMSINTF